MSDAATTPAPPRAPAGKGASRACFKCGKTGHWSKDCTAPREEWIPQRPYGEAGVPQSPTDVGGEGEGDPKPATATKKKSTRKPKFTVRALTLPIPPPSRVAVERQRSTPRSTRRGAHGVLFETLRGRPRFAPASSSSSTR